MKGELHGALVLHQWFNSSALAVIAFVSAFVVNPSAVSCTVKESTMGEQINLCHLYLYTTTALLSE